MTHEQSLNEIRINNLYTLEAEAHEETPAELAEKIGVSIPHLSGVKTQGRPFNDKLARKVELAYNLPAFWIDEDHKHKKMEYDYQTVFVTFERICDSATIRSLFDETGVKGKVKLFDAIYTLFIEDKAAQKLSPKTLYKLIGVNKNEQSAPRKEE